MTIERIAAGPALPAGFPFSLATRAGDLCFISGMPAIDASTGRFVAGSFIEEADRAWRNVLAIAAAVGCGAESLLFVSVLLADIDDYEELNAWWRRQFPDPSRAPARMTFQAAALPFGAKIELQAVAGRGGGD